MSFDVNRLASGGCESSGFALCTTTFLGFGIFFFTTRRGRLDIEVRFGFRIVVSLGLGLGLSDSLT